ncbi:MAG: hypothetical protein JW995_06680 [Melioribacteraceae bacterium]|nr:hypothetical protein [Melioribacteraceae bacterium]
MKFYFLLLYIITTLFVYAQNNLKIVKHLEGITVYDVCGDGQNIWAATNGNGVFAYSEKNQKWTNYSTMNNRLQIDFFYSIDASKDYVFAGSTDGIFILNKKRNNWSKRKFGKGGQLSNWIRSVKYDEIDNVAWIGRFKYLSKFDIKNRRFVDYDLTANGDEKTNTIKVIQVDGDSLVWFGTENGLHKYDKSRSLEEPGTVTFYDNSKNYFRGEGDAVSISAILIEQNYVWIGLDEFITKLKPEYNVGGVYRFDRRNEWLRFDVSSGLGGNGISDIVRTGNFLWVSLYQFSMNSKEQYGRGLALINRLTEEVIPLRESSLPTTVFAMHYDGKYIWFAADNGLYQLDLSNTFVSEIKNLQE